MEDLDISTVRLSKKQEDYIDPLEISEELFCTIIVRKAHEKLSDKVNMHIAMREFDHKDEKQEIFSLLRELADICNIHISGRKASPLPWGYRKEIEFFCESFNWKLNEIKSVCQRAGISLEESTYYLEPDKTKEWCKKWGEVIFANFKDKKVVPIKKDTKPKIFLYVGQAQKKVEEFNRKYFEIQILSVESAFNSFEQLIEEYRDNSYISKEQIARVSSTLKFLRSKFLFFVQKTRLTRFFLDSFKQVILDVEKNNREVFWSSSYNKIMQEETGIPIEDEIYTPDEGEFIERHYFDDEGFLDANGNPLDVEVDKIVGGAKKEIEAYYLEKLKEIGDKEKIGHYNETALAPIVEKILSICRYAYQTDEWLEKEKEFVEKNIFKI